MTQLQRITIAPDQLQADKVLLTRQQLHYLFHVLRLRSGDFFIVMDGVGQWWLSQLLETEAQIIREISIQTELPLAITLMVALPKGNSFDAVVRYCTELGATCIAPVLSERTLPLPNSQKLERWRRIAQEAAEQSERQVVPEILAPAPFLPVRSENYFYKYLCVARGSYPHLISCLPTILKPTASETMVIATGPEGGWTPEEIDTAIAAGFQPVSLGRRILKAITAPIAALSIVAAGLEGGKLNSQTSA